MINPNFILPNNNSEISKIERGKPAFPCLNYSTFSKLEDSPRLRSSIKGIKTILRNLDFGCIVDSTEDEDSSDIVNQVENLEKTIDKMITGNSDLSSGLIHSKTNELRSVLETIFHLIQLWGGVAGRSIYIRGNGFNGNFRIEKYLKQIKLCKDLKMCNTLITIENRIPYLGISFASKHWKFWSNHELPILDSVLSKGILGMKYPKWDLYPNFVSQILAAAKFKGVSLRVFERNIFNFFQSPIGKEWIKLRTS